MNMFLCYSGYSDQNPQCLPHLSRYGGNNFAPQAHAPLRLGHSASMPSPLHAHLPQHGRGPPYGPYGPNIEGPRLVHPAILPTHSLPPAAFMQMNSEMLQSQMAGYLYVDVNSYNCTPYAN